MDDESSTPDTQVICYWAKGEEKCTEQNKRYLLQSSTISLGDNQVLLRTQKKQDKNQLIYKCSSQNEDTIRNSKPQVIEGSFPIAMYNIGIKRLVIQTYLDKANRMIYNLQENESFIDFIQFNKLEDLGFNDKGLKIEACSRFAFLTLNKET